MLALGDRQYDHYCGFGRALDGWLASTGAAAVAARIDVDNGDPVSLAAWRALWGAGADTEAAEPSAAPFVPWQLSSRTLLNPHSAGAPIYEVALAAPADAAPANWHSGDLVQIAIASDPTRPRDYSIASIPSDGRIELLVRQEQHPDGTLGAASGLLTSTLAIGDTAALRLRPHRRFRLEANADRPLILIGNGTGLAGLRSHLRERIAAGQFENWLVFGERNVAHDFLCRNEIEAWQAHQRLARLDLIFSRDQADRVYVQHRLLQVSDEVRAWVSCGAAIYVCGSLQGMATGVDAALRDILGADAVQALTVDGRYRRDVY